MTKRKRQSEKQDSSQPASRQASPAEGFDPAADNLPPDLARGVTTPPDNAALLGAEHVSRTMRQALARKLNRRHGNRHARRLVAPSGVQRVRGGRAPDAADPEHTAVDVTGRYEAIEPGGNNRITIQINQAGRYFHGWWQNRSLTEGTSRQQSFTQYILDGELVSQSDTEVAFRYVKSHATSSRTTSGVLTARRERDGVRLSLRHDHGWSHDFRQTGTDAALSDEAIAGAPEPVRDVVEARERAPLDSQEEALVAGVCEQLGGWLSRYLGTSRGIARDGIAGQIDSFLERELRPFLGGTGGRTPQLPLVRRRMLEHLTEPMLTGGNVSRSHWDWLQVVIAAHPRYTDYAQALLGIDATGQSVDSDAPQNQYRWRFTVGGLAGDVGIGLGGFLGSFEIQKLAPDTWSESYFTIMGQVSGGLSAGVTVGMHTDWSTFATPFAWSSGNFAGGYALSGGAASGAPGIGGGRGEGFIIFYGDGTFPEIAADASGWFVQFGAYIGAELSETGGYMWGGREEAIRNAPRTRPGDAGESRYETGESVHFDVDDPSLTEEGRQAIREMVAHHRAALASRGGTLQIDGYTSTTGSPERNQTLSQLRAQNVLQAIRDLLGPAFGLEASDVNAEGHGEDPAHRAGQPDETENVEWRRVDVTLNGQIVLSLS